MEVLPSLVGDRKKCFSNFLIKENQLTYKKNTDIWTQIIGTCGGIFNFEPTSKMYYLSPKVRPNQHLKL